MEHKKEEILKIRITKEQREAYHIWCEKHGFKMSKRIREFMNKEMKSENNKVI